VLSIVMAVSDGRVRAQFREVRKRVKRTKKNHDIIIVSQNLFSPKKGDSPQRTQRKALINIREKEISLCTH